MGAIKVLLGAPTSKIKDYCFIDWLSNIKRFTFPVDIVLVDNSADTDYYEYLKQFKGIKVFHVDQAGRDSQAYITDSQNVIRDYFLAHDYTHYFSLESDIFPRQMDIVERLIDHDQPLISGVYPIGLGEDTELLIGQYISNFEAKNSVYGIVVKDLMGFWLMDGTVKEVAHCGIGCSMIERSVIEQIPFRYIAGEPQHSDSYFYADCFAIGITALIDTAIQLDHRNIDWGLFSDTKNN